MKKMTLLLLALSVLGCSKGQAPKPEARGNADITIPQALIGNAPADPSEVLVEVNGTKLTRGEAMRQVALRLGGPPPADMPAGRVAIVRSQAMSQVVDQFVKRTLLLEEADRQGITAKAAEVDKGLQLIRSQTPEGKLPAGIVQDGPAGRDALRNEVVIGIRIDKLIAKALPVSAPSDAEIDAFIDENREKLTHKEKGLVPRDEISKVMQTKARQKALSAYIRKLQESANIHHAAAVRPPVYAE